MREYYILWTYFVNYGDMVIMAKNPGDAIDKVLAGFSDDFKVNGKIKVFLNPPVALYN